MEILILIFKPLHSSRSTLAANQKQKSSCRCIINYYYCCIFAITTFNTLIAHLIMFSLYRAAIVLSNCTVFHVVGGWYQFSAARVQDYLSPEQVEALELVLGSF